MEEIFDDIAKGKITINDATKELGLKSTGFPTSILKMYKNYVYKTQKTIIDIEYEDVTDEQKLI